MSKRFGDIKWGDVDLDEEQAQSTQLPVPAATSTKPDAKGIKTVVEYTTNDKGEKVKVTRKIKVTTKQVKINKRVLARRKWAKFGDAKNAPPGPEQNVTYQSFEVINLDLRPKIRQEEKEESSLDKLAGTNSIVVCRNCGETGHWTLKCPKRAEIMPSQKATANAAADSAAAAASSGAGASSEGGASKYVPLHLRNADKRGVSSLRDDSFTLRVTNISEDTTEQDLADLFNRVARVQRVYLAKDRQTGESRGFAFVNYYTRTDAQAAIEKLNGHGYDNLILRVEWAKPKEQKDGEERAGYGRK